MNTTIYFVRHAYSDYTPEELTRPLTERGIVDAKHVTEKLQHEDIHYVISSPYKRAIGTHGNIMVLMMNYFDNSYDYNFWKTLDMPDIYKLSFHGIELKEVNRLWDKRV